MRNRDFKKNLILFASILIFLFAIIPKEASGLDENSFSQSSQQDFEKGVAENLEIVDGEIKLSYETMSFKEDFKSSDNIDKTKTTAVLDKSKRIRLPLVFDENLKISTPSSLPSPPGPRTGSSMVINPTKNDIYIIGGSDGKEQPKFYDQIVKYTTGEATSKVVGKLPSGRAASAAVYDSNSNKIYIFGGMVDSSIPGVPADATDKIVVFDLSNNNAYNLASVKLPQTCAAMGAIYANNGKSYIFGGFRGIHDVMKYGEPLDQILEFDPNANAGAGSITKIASLPSALGGSAIAYDSKTNKAYIIGGADSLDYTKATMSKKIFLYDLNNPTATPIYYGDLPYIWGGSSGLLTYTDEESKPIIYILPGLYKDGSNLYCTQEIMLFDITTKKIKRNVGSTPDSIYYEPGIYSQDNGIFIAGGTNYNNGAHTPSDEIMNIKQSYKKEAVVYSKIIDTTKDIYKATLTATDKTNNQEINYYLSADGGAHWRAIQSNGIEIIFEKYEIGSSLQWYAVLKTSDTEITPTISEITITYKTVYEPFGTYTSAIFYAPPKTAIYWDKISWEGSKDSVGSLSFQIRTSSSQTKLSSAYWYGPTSNSDYYTNSSGTKINPVHNGDCWIQYKAFFSTKDKTKTPILKKVKLTYTNVPATPILIEPQNNILTSTNKPIFKWKFQDPDGDMQAFFHVQIDDENNFISPDYDIEEKLASSSWQPTTFIQDGNWYWRVRTKDEHGAWGNWSDPRIIRIDTKKPSVISVFPNNLDENLPIATDISIKFSEQMDKDSVEDAFSISDGIIGKPAWNDDKTEVTFTLSKKLNYEREYRVTIGKGACDIAGNCLETIYSWSFTTITAPQVVKTIPENGGEDVDIDSEIILIFNRPMNFSSVEEALQILSSNSLNFQTNWNPDLDTLTISPTTALEYDEAYTVKVGQDAKDKDGNNLPEEFLLTFSTVGEEKLSK
ncbi:MAG: Ig-like domain-containing protein, partial [Candidatus Thermoplasmatota archaeon]